MSIIKCLYLFFTCIMVFKIPIQIAQASDITEEREEYVRRNAILKGQRSQISLEKEEVGFLSLQSIPIEMIVHIADYLLGNDFQNFASTSKDIKVILTNYDLFFMPKKEEDASNRLKNTSLQRIKLLAETWSRGEKKTIFQILESISEKNYQYVPSVSCQNRLAEDVLETVKMYIKARRMMIYLGSKKAKDSLEMSKDQILCNLMMSTNEEELGQDKESARFNLIKAAMVSDKVTYIIPEEYMTSLGIDCDKEILLYKPFGQWIPYSIPLENQI